MCCFSPLPLLVEQPGRACPHSDLQQRVSRHAAHHSVHGVVWGLDGRRNGEAMKPPAKSKPSGAKLDLRFHHVLVPTDLTDRTEKALQLADKLALTDRPRITLVHVIETIDGVQFDELKPFYERLEKKARAGMEHDSSAVFPKGSRRLNLSSYTEDVPRKS